MNERGRRSMLEMTGSMYEKRNRYSHTDICTYIHMAQGKGSKRYKLQLPEEVKTCSLECRTKVTLVSVTFSILFIFLNLTVEFV